MSIPRDDVLSTRRVPTIGSIRQRENRNEAVRLAKDGFPVGVFVRAVAVIIVDSANSSSVDAIYRLKGEQRIGKPMATLFPAESMVRLMDPERIPAELRHIFLDPKELESRLGALASIRVPILRDSVAYLPPSLASESDDGNYWLQSWVPDQTSPGGLLVRELQEQGVTLPGVTSMNTSGNPEIADQSEALSFSAAYGVPYFLGDPEARSPVRGSFPILQVGPEGIRLVRQGHLSVELFHRLLDGAAIDESHAHPSRFPLLREDGLSVGSSPYELHDTLVSLLEGMDDASPLVFSSPGT